MRRCVVLWVIVTVDKRAVLRVASMAVMLIALSGTLGCIVGCVLGCEDGTVHGGEEGCEDG